jgi:hypothetical protein
MSEKVFTWVCEFCFRTVVTNVLPDSWKLVWQSAVCPKCQPKVERDGGYEVVCGGAYAGQRKDPRAK